MYKRQDGKVITENSGPFERESFFTKFEDKSLKDLPQKIVQSLKSIGINFGVQLEFQADPQKPFIFNLVQIRPTPGNMLKPIDSNVEDDTLFPNILAQSAMFNAPFNVSGIGETVSDAEDLSYARFYNDIESLYDRESIALINGRSGEMETFPFDYGAGVSQSVHLGTWGRGYRAAITPLSLNPLYRHDSRDEYAGQMQLAADHLDVNFPTLQLPLEVINQISEEASGKSIQVYSDGLIAQVRSVL